MVNTEIITKYDDEISAEECCSNSSVEIDKYKCGECGTEHDDEEDADECCSKVKQ